MSDGQTVQQSRLLLFTFFLRVGDRCAIFTVAQTEKKVKPRKRIKIDKKERKTTYDPKLNITAEETILYQDVPNFSRGPLAV